LYGLDSAEALEEGEPIVQQPDEQMLLIQLGTVKSQGV